MKRQFPSVLEEPNINITPLIDVVFVVLIMFILIAPLLDKETIELAQSNSSEKISPADLENPYRVLIRKDNVIVFGKNQIDLKQLEKKMEEAKKNNPKAPLLVLPDKGCSFGTFQKVKNAAEKAGFHELQIVLDPNL